MHDIHTSDDLSAKVIETDSCRNNVTSTVVALYEMVLWNSTGNDFYINTPPSSFLYYSLRTFTCFLSYISRYFNLCILSSLVSPFLPTVHLSPSLPSLTFTSHHSTSQCHRTFLSFLANVSLFLVHTSHHIP
jgi:hypothetical protein